MPALELNDALPTFHIVVFGIGTVGAQFISQVFQQQRRILERRGVWLQIVGIANSKGILLDPEGIGQDWQARLQSEQVFLEPEAIGQRLDAAGLANRVAVDATPSLAFTQSYPDFIRAGFDLVAANKIANALDLGFYHGIRELLLKNGKRFLYETNVGAGLPLVDTLRQLHLSGDQIVRVRGVFSGSLSFIFNTFSETEQSFSEVLTKAQALGLTEPDPREDLSGNDVARKVLILARELDLELEFEDVLVENLIPVHLRSQSDCEEFLERVEELDSDFAKRKAGQDAGHVLRYTGEVQVATGKLLVGLESVPKDSPLGQVKGQDAIFEVFTESYGAHPLVIQGAGAGGVVTARGILGDVLRLADPDRWRAAAAVV